MKLLLDLQCPEKSVMVRVKVYLTESHLAKGKESTFTVSIEYRVKYNALFCGLVTLREPPILPLREVFSAVLRVSGGHYTRLV